MPNRLNKGPISSGSVHIVLSDRGWILEQLAKELADRLPYVSYGLDPDPAAPIQYYITYGCRRERVSPVEIALFTHREEDPEAAARFDAAARDVDHAIAMSSTTSRIVSGLGVTGHSCIEPGVDLDRFQPKLKIAVVGRTYHTGRKGEALVQAVMDLPGIEWHFTGTGWPGPAEHVSDADLPAFYRAMDYILVPASNEGGPMSVLEALASGVQVIASDVGWVPDFPHIPFERGNAKSLRRVLETLVDKRRALRSSVEHMTWSRWASEHDAVFRRLLKGISPFVNAKVETVAARTVHSVALVTHGSESTTLGGPSVRVPGTSRALAALGVSAGVFHRRNGRMADMDVIHGYNIWAPSSAVAVARYAKTLRRPLVFSPIMLDLSEISLWRRDLPRAFNHAASADEADVAVRRYTALYRERLALYPPAEPEPGYRDMAKEIAELSDGLIYLSERERSVFEALVGGTGTPGYLVRNPVDTEHFRSADRDLFRTAYGLGDYVLCVARIEPRKNQLMLAAALRDTGLPLVMVGHTSSRDYLKLIRRYAGPNLVIIDRLEPGSDMLRSAIAGARVFALPSWAEGAPLAALEAASAGASMVLSDRSGEREYFGDRARYCDPSSMASIRSAIVEAWEAPFTAEESDSLSNFVAESYSWEQHARETLKVYEDVSARVEQEHPAQATVLQPACSGVATEIVLDVTTWANNARPWAGIARVERSIAAELMDDPSVRARFILYKSSGGAFVEIPRQIIQSGVVSSYVAQINRNDDGAQREFRLAAGSEFIVVGSGWMQNGEYARDVVALARSAGANLSVMMHDLCPALFPHWFPDKYSPVWEQNCATIIAGANRLIVYSENTCADVTEFCSQAGLEMPPIEKVRLADVIETAESRITAEGLAARALLDGKKFVMSVGAIHVRKNYGLLYDVWLLLREAMGVSCPHLVIVGGVSWNGAEIARMMTEDKRVNQYIHIVENIDDATLDWLYERADVTAYPSLYEGWGLPVGESLAHGKICIASDSSSMREIAPALTDLIDPMDRSRWAAMIRHYVSSRSAREQREAQIRTSFVVTTWGQTAADILRALCQPSRHIARTRYNLGEVALTARGKSGRQFLRAGWFQPEGWGCWSKSDVAELAVDLVHEPTEDLVLTVLAKVMKPFGSTREYEVRVNDVSIGHWRFFPRAASGNQHQDTVVSRVRVPLDLLRGTRALQIQLIADRLCAVTEVTPGSTDKRSMGLGLVAFVIEARSFATDPTELFHGDPEIRAALRTAEGVDLQQALTTSAFRPSAIPDRWERNLAPFTLVGQAKPDQGVADDRGSIRFAVGLARLRFDHATAIEFVMDADHATADFPITIAVFMNDAWIKDIRLDSAEPSQYIVDIPSDTLAKADPLIISCLCSSMAKDKKTSFTISSLRMVQNITAHSESIGQIEPGRLISIGTSDRFEQTPDHLLDEGWYLLEKAGAWSVAGIGRLRIGGAAGAALVLHLSRLSSGKADDRVAVVDKDGRVLAEIDFPMMIAGAVHVPRRMLVAADMLGDGVDTIDIRIVPNNLGWPADEPRVDGRRLGVQLFSVALVRLEDILSGHTVHVGTEPNRELALLEGWHDREVFGCWTGVENAAVVLRLPDDGAATTVRFSGAILPGSVSEDAKEAPCLLVDGDTRYPITMNEAGSWFVDIDSAVFKHDSYHLIEFSGKRPVSPMELGLGSDSRQLGFHLLTISSVMPASDADEYEREEPVETDEMALAGSQAAFSENYIADISAEVEGVLGLSLPVIVDKL